MATLMQISGDQECYSGKQALNPKNGEYIFLSCAVRAGADPSELGLITGHAYSVLKMTLAKDGKQFVQVLSFRTSKERFCM